MYKLFYIFLRSVLMILFLNVQLTIAQENESENRESEEEKNVISLSFAYTYIPQGAGLDSRRNDRNQLVPTFGLDYFRRIHRKWEVGVMLDYELATYIIPRKDNLTRENAFIVALMSVYNLNANWNLLLGGGIELEKHENLAVLRAGIEYVIPIRNNWSIPISSFLDFKEGYDTWSFGLGFKKGF